MPKCLAWTTGSVYFQVFGTDCAPHSAPKMTSEARLGDTIAPDCTRFAGDAAHLLVGRSALLPNGLPDPVVIASLSEGREGAALPAPLYLSGADAEMPRVGPPKLLD